MADERLSTSARTPDERIAPAHAKMPAREELPPLGADIDRLLADAEEALMAAGGPADGTAMPFEWQDLEQGSSAGGTDPLDRIRDVELDLTIELGRVQMALEDLVKLRKGSVVALDKLVGEPVDILAGGQLIGHGEVVVLNDNFCVRVTQLVADGQRPPCSDSSA
jgi:flagellar motor switch protein FliN/FliY